MAVKCLPDGRWAVYYQLDGKKKWEYFGRGELAEVNAKRRDEEIRSEKGKHPASTGITIFTLLEEYHRRHFVEDSTRDSDFYRIDRILVPLMGSLFAESLTTTDLDGYVEKRVAAGRALRTIDRELDILRSAYAWAEQHQPPLIVRNPMKGYRVGSTRQPKPVAQINPISQKDFRSLMMFAPDHLLRAMLLQWYGGQRPGKETLGIRWMDVDFDNKEILVHSAHKGAIPERYVPIHPELLKHLLEWHGEDASVFGEKLDEIPVVHFRGAQVESLKRTWATTKRKAGIKRKMRMYDFRHAWFTNALRAGADLKSVSETGGHSQPATTMTFYQHTVREQHHAAVEKIPAVAMPRRAVQIGSVTQLPTATQKVVKDKKKPAK